MSDWADLASEREQQIRDEALERVTGGTLKRQVEASAECCAVCEDPIPEARREALPGVQTCIDCQEELESELRHNRRGF